MHIKHALYFCLSHPHGDIYAIMKLYKNMHINMFSNSQHFESKFWCIPFRDNAKCIWTCFPFSSKRSFCPHNYFSRCPWSRNWFSSKKRFSHLFTSAEEFLLCSFLTGDQYLTASVSKALSFLLRRTCPYPVIVEKTTYSNIVCIFSYETRYAQSSHSNFVFFILMGTFMPR